MVPERVWMVWGQSVIHVKFFSVFNVAGCDKKYCFGLREVNEKQQNQSAFFTSHKSRGKRNIEPGTIPLVVLGYLTVDKICLECMVPAQLAMVHHYRRKGDNERYRPRYQTFPAGFVSVQGIEGNRTDKA